MQRGLAYTLVMKIEQKTVEAFMKGVKTRNFGFTLVELMFAIAIAAILISLAVPSFQNLLDRKRLVGAAESLYSHLQFAKSEAIKQSIAVPVVFADVGCTITLPQGDRVLAVPGNDFPGVTIGGLPQTITFDGQRGTANAPLALTLTSARGQTVSVDIIRTGRIKVCGGAGYQGC